MTREREKAINATDVMAIWLNLTINLVIALFLYFILRRELRKRLLGNDPLTKLRKETEEIIGEFNQTADRNITLLEERLSQLRRLLSQADQRITLLKNQPPPTPLVYTKTRTGQGFASVSTNRNNHQNKQSNSEMTTAEKVLGLSAQGLPAKAIAERVNRSLGEVELILSLGEKR